MSFLPYSHAYVMRCVKFNRIVPVILFCAILSAQAAPTLLPSSYSRKHSFPVRLF